jgi:hypothetical protein
VQSLGELSVTEKHNKRDDQNLKMLVHTLCQNLHIVLYVWLSARIKLVILTLFEFTRKQESAKRKLSHTTFNTGKDRDNLTLFICILWTVNKWIGKFGREEEEWCIYLIIPLLEAQVTYWGGGGIS